MSVCVLIFVAASAAAGQGESRPAPTSPGLSWAAADSLAGKLARIEAAARKAIKPPARAQSMEVSESEVNSYLNLTLGPKMPPELSEVAFRIEPNRIAGTGLVDLDKLKAKIPASGPFNPLSFLGGRVPVDLKTQLPTENGMGSLVVEELSLGGVSLPMSLVQQIVMSATRTRENPRGFDVQMPFRLPNDVKKVRLGTGKAWLDY